MTFKNGRFVANYIGDGEVDKSNIQPNGVDLEIGEIFRVSGIPRITEGEYDMGKRDPLSSGNNGLVSLNPEPYVIQYKEKIRIPDGCVGYVLPRSRICRCGAFLTSALWDAGYEGKGEGLLMPQTRMEIQEDMTVGQIVFADADEADELYDGVHQGENL